MSKSILNIAAGKILPFEYSGSQNSIKLYEDMSFLVNLDSMYLNSVDIKEVLHFHSEYENVKNNMKNLKQFYNPTKMYCNFDVYEFLEKYHIQFEGISIYRFLEHVPKVKILYFIYLLSTAIKVGSIIDVIVPDYKILAQRILNEDVFGSKNFEAEDIITTFELLNEPYCPHASVWTEDRIKYFFTLEGRFEILGIQKNYNFDGRDLYLRFLAKRIK